MSSLTLNKTVHQGTDVGNDLFPVFLKLREFHTLLVGAGKVGLEKLSAMLNNSPDAKISIVADHIAEEVELLAIQYPAVTIYRRKFEETDLDGISLAILATDDPALHKYIHELAIERNLLVNVADTPGLCDFYLGSIVKKGNLKVAISTNGKSPTMAKRLKQVFHEGIPEEIDETLENMNKVRDTLNGDFAYKVKKLNSITEGLVLKKKPLPSQQIRRRTIIIALLILIGVSFWWFWQHESTFGTALTTIPTEFYYFFGAGFLFALIDGAIGMSYGVTTTTFSLSMGVPPASASMAVHISEIFSNGIAGWMHNRLKNVNKKLFKALVVPGIIGAVIGAALLSSLEEYEHFIRPLISCYTLILGIVIFKKALTIYRGRKVNRNNETTNKNNKITKVTPLGFGGGFIDAVGGGGWGSIVLSTLIAGGRNARYALGSVKASRFFIAIFSSLTFFTLLNELHWAVMIGLVFGSAAAAPIAVGISHRIPVKMLMLAVSILVILVSIYNIFHIADL